MKAVEYPYQYQVEVIFHHLDVMGHVNNVNKQTIPIPDQLRQRIHEFQNGWQLEEK